MSQGNDGEPIKDVPDAHAEQGHNHELRALRNEAVQESAKRMIDKWADVLHRLAAESHIQDRDNERS
jgi:hypothetical protein